MTSMAEAKCSALLGKRRRGKLDPLPPPASSSKPLTPFSIEDILNKTCVKRNQPLLIPHRESSPSDGLLLGQSSPLCALEELASKTFKGLEVSVLQAAEGRDGQALFGHRNAPKKRRKSRTAFTNHQVYELEKRFLYQKYLSPADRDQIAQHLGLTNAQVITWFQNRRAKLKRDLEEMKADVESATAAGAVTFEKLSKLAELEKLAAEGLGQVTRSLNRAEPDQRSGRAERDLNRPCASPPPSPAPSRDGGGLGSRWASEDGGDGEEEEEEIDVDD